jgi:TolA-binding protein
VWTLVRFPEWMSSGTSSTRLQLAETLLSTSGGTGGTTTGQGVLIAAIAAVPGTIGALLAYRAATSTRRREARSEARRVDSEAFARAETIYKGAIDQLEEQIHDLQDRAKETGTELRRLEQRDREKTAELAVLKRRNAQLTQAIVDLGGTVPPVK